MLLSGLLMMAAKRAQPPQQVLPMVEHARPNPRLPRPAVESLWAPAYAPVHPFQSDSTVQKLAAQKLRMAVVSVQTGSGIADWLLSNPGRQWRLEKWGRPNGNATIVRAPGAGCEYLKWLQ